MSTTANLRLFNCGIIGKPHSLEQTIEAFHDIGFDSSMLEVGSLARRQFAYWSKYDDQTRRELKLAYDNQQLSFVSADANSFIILTVRITWSLSDMGQPVDALLHAEAFQTTMFTEKEYDPEHHAQRFVELARRLYDLVQPGFGWIERCWPSGYTRWRDVENLAVPHIYWANFFGPAYVGKLGRGFLLNAPGWKTEELADGGILYVLSPSLAGTGPKKLVDQVKRYFGIESARRRQKKREKKREKR